MKDLAPVIENSPVYPDSDAFLSAHRTVPRPLIGLRTLLDSHMKIWDDRCDLSVPIQNTGK